MKKITLSLFTLAVLAFTGQMSAQQVESADYSNPNPSLSSTIEVGEISTHYQVLGGILYQNGPYFDTPGGGFGGADLSTLENTTLGENILGFNHSFSSGRRIADDWEVTEAVEVTSIDFYAYETGSTTMSSFNYVSFQIWDGDPSDPASIVIYGDNAISAMVNTEWSGAYRATEASPMGDTRPIMRNTVETPGLVLTPGTYWLDWDAGGTVGSGPWAPPITILGSSETGNALQYNPNDGMWYPVLDYSATTGLGTSEPQGFPFDVTGTVLSLVDNSFEGFSYYPNPTTNILNVNAKSNIENITIFNVLGQQLINLSPDSLTAKVDISNLSAGMYVMKATVNGNVGSFNIIKR